MNRKILFLTTAIIAGLSATSARAGFEWNPPPAKQAAASPAVPAPSGSSDTLGPLTPMPGEPAPVVKVEQVSEADIMDNGTQMPPVTSRAGMKSIGNAPQPLENIESENLPVPNQNNSGENISWSQPQTSAVVEGFGKDIPLAVAMQQIVPSNYVVSYQGGVDQGKPVTWNGGSVWTNVASDMLKSSKLHGVMSGNTITIADGVGADLQMQAPPSVVSPTVSDVPMAMAAGGRPILDMTQQKNWTAQAGQSLRETLQNWSGSANVELAWQDAKDMPISSAFSYNGTYDQAVDALLSLYSGGANEPKGKLYPNLPEGPSVLVIGSN